MRDRLSGCSDGYVEETMNREMILENVERIRRELAEAAEGRYPVPRLMAVTKTRPPEEILLLKDAGITVPKSSPNRLKYSS